MVRVRRREEKKGERIRRSCERKFSKDTRYSQCSFLPFFSPLTVVRLQERPGSVDDGVDGEAVALCSGLDASERPSRRALTASWLLFPFFLLLLPLSSSPLPTPLFPAASPPFPPPSTSEGRPPVLEQASPVLLGLLRSSDPGTMARSSHSTVALNAHGTGLAPPPPAEALLLEIVLLVGASFAVASPGFVGVGQVAKDDFERPAVHDEVVNRHDQKPGVVRRAISRSRSSGAGRASWYPAYRRPLTASVRGCRC